MSFKWVADGKKFSDVQIQWCYNEKLFQLRISWISIVVRCLVSTLRGLHLYQLSWHCFGSGIGSRRVLSSGARVSNYPTRPSPNIICIYIYIYLIYMDLVNPTSVLSNNWFIYTFRIPQFLCRSYRINRRRCLVSSRNQMSIWHIISVFVRNVIWISKKSFNR